MMEFRDFFLQLSQEEREDFAARCETTVRSLLQVAYSQRKNPCGSGLAIKIERESGGKVRCESLCNTVDWAYIRGTAKRRRNATARAA